MSEPITIPPIGIFGAQALSDIAQEDGAAYAAVLTGFVHGLVKPVDLIPGRTSALVDRVPDIMGALVELGLDPSHDDLLSYQHAINGQVSSDSDDAAADLVAADDPKSPPVPSLS